MRCEPGTPHLTRRDWLKRAAASGAATAFAARLLPSSGAEKPAAGLDPDAAARRVAPELIVDVDVNDDFSEWLPAAPAELKTRMQFWADVTRRHGFDGIDVHEAWNFESPPANMAILGSMADRLKAMP